MKKTYLEKIRELLDLTPEETPDIKFNKSEEWITEAYHLLQDIYKEIKSGTL